MKRTLFMLVFALLAFGVAAQPENWSLYADPVIKFLNDKTYTGDKRSYTEADLLVPADVEKALDRLGLSRFALLRNEIWARHGYVFKTAIFDWLFGKTRWYKKNPNFGMGNLVGIPAKNADWIKTLEDEWDYQNIGWWLDDRSYYGDLRLYLSDSDYVVPDSVRISANHLGIRPSRLLVNEIYARKGYIFPDQVTKRLFGTCLWYKPKTTDIQVITSRFNVEERTNIELCLLRENLDNLEIVNYSLPEGVTWVPTINYGALFIRSFLGPDGSTYHYSSTNLWHALEFDPKSIGTQKTDTEQLIDEATYKAIVATNDPLEKLVLYFSKKRYAGYVDTVIFNKLDMQIPSYLKSAVEVLDIDWYVLLRKEIHARNGAIFTDKKVGPIFAACPWYKAKYNLSPSSPTRFPSSVKISKAELANFFLLEGEDISRRVSGEDLGTTPKIEVDLSGSWYWIETETINIDPNGEALTVPILYKSDAKLKPYAMEIIRRITSEQGFDLDAFIESQSQYFLPGC